MKTFKEILEFVLDAGSNHLYVFGGKFQGGYELQQDPEEITQFLHEFQKTKIENFIEIGVAAGGNTRVLCDFLDIKNIYTIDLNEHPSINDRSNPGARDKNFSSLKNHGTLNNFYGDSHSIEAFAWLEKHKVQFDMAFIDGDHTFDGIKMDTELVIKFIKPGGLIVFHDTLIDVGSSQFDFEMRNGLFKNVVFLKNYCSGKRTQKGISIYQYVAN